MTHTHRSQCIIQGRYHQLHNQLHSKQIRPIQSGSPIKSLKPENRNMNRKSKIGQHGLKDALVGQALERTHIVFGPAPQCQMFGAQKSSDFPSFQGMTRSWSCGTSPARATCSSSSAKRWSMMFSSSPPLLGWLDGCCMGKGSGSWEKVKENGRMKFALVGL